MWNMLIMLIVWLTVPGGLVPGAPLPGQLSCPNSGAACITYDVIPTFEVAQLLPLTSGYQVIGCGEGVIVNDWSRANGLGAVKNVNGEWYWAQQYVPFENYGWYEGAPGFIAIANGTSWPDYNDAWGKEHCMVLRFDPAVGAYGWGMQP